MFICMAVSAVYKECIHERTVSQNYKELCHIPLTYLVNEVCQI